MPVKTKPPKSSETAPERTRRRILGGARECFARLGIDKATVTDIAAAADYSRPVIYKHFKDKDDIVDSVCLEEMVALQLELGNRIGRDQAFVDQLGETIAEAVALAHDNIYIQRFMQDRETWVRSQTAVGRVHVWVRERWSRFLARGQAEGILADDLDLDQCVTWISMSQSLLLLRYASEEIDRAALHGFVRRFVVTPLLVRT
jgi:AcrR family transcriptional regulator